MWNNSPERTLSQEKVSMFDPKDCCEEMSIIAEYGTVLQNLLRSTIVGSAAFNLFIISAASLAEDFEALNHSVGKLSVCF